MSTNSTPQRSVLLLDDQPRYVQSSWVPTLKANGYQVQVVTTVTDAYGLLNRQRHGIDFVLLDLLMMDATPPELAHEQQLVDDALLRNGRPREFTSQALGLWLWRQHRPYAYLTSYEALWMRFESNVEYNEFAGASDLDLATLVCGRSTEGHPVTFVDRALAIWQTHWPAPVTCKAAS